MSDIRKTESYRSAKYAVSLIPGEALASTYASAWSTYESAKAKGVLDVVQAATVVAIMDVRALRNQFPIPEIDREVAKL